MVEQGTVTELTKRLIGQNPFDRAPKEMVTRLKMQHLKGIFMPPTSKKLEGHIAFGSFQAFKRAYFSYYFYFSLFIVLLLFF